MWIKNLGVKLEYVDTYFIFVDEFKQNEYFFLKAQIGETNLYWNSNPQWHWRSWGIFT